MPQFIPVSSSSGGASFAFDGVTFSPGTYTADSGARTVEIELTLNGNAITSGEINLFFSVIGPGGNPWSSDGYDVNGADWRFYLWDGVYSVTASILCGVSAADGHVIASSEIYKSSPGDDTAQVVIMMPDGRYIASDGITIPGTGMPA